MDPLCPLGRAGWTPCVLRASLSQRGPPMPLSGQCVTPMSSRLQCDHLRPLRTKCVPTLSQLTQVWVPLCPMGRAGWTPVSSEACWVDTPVSSEACCAGPPASSEAWRADPLRPLRRAVWTPCALRGVLCGPPVPSEASCMDPPSAPRGEQGGPPSTSSEDEQGGTTWGPSGHKGCPDPAASSRGMQGGPPNVSLCGVLCGPPVPAEACGVDTLCPLRRAGWTPCALGRAGRTPCVP